MRFDLMRVLGVTLALGLAGLAPVAAAETPGEMGIRTGEPAQPQPPRTTKPDQPRPVAQPQRPTK